MTKVKICGIRRDEDISYINDLKPDYAGFVFAKSKRRVDPERARRLISNMDDGIRSVGVFVNEDIERVVSISKECGLDIIQLHGDEDVKYVEKLKGFDVWKAVRVKSRKDMESVDLNSNVKYLFDAYNKESYGGCGDVFNWSLLEDLKTRNFALAGGLDIKNIGAAISIVNPQIVDVSSGVETRGLKDYEKMKKFIERVRCYGKQQY